MQPPPIDRPGRMRCRHAVDFLTPCRPEGAHFIPRREGGLGFPAEDENIYALCYPQESGGDYRSLSYAEQMHG